MEYTFTTYNIFKLHLPFSRQYVGILEKHNDFLAIQEWVGSLRISEDKYSITVHPQQSRNFWQPEQGSSKTIRPDIVVEYSDKIIIIDSKWKNIGDHHPSDEDLKQMFVYNLFWECEKSFLLYPGVTQSSSGKYHSHEINQEMGSSCGVEQVQVLDGDGKLSKNIGKDIVKLIL